MNKDRFVEPLDEVEDDQITDCAAEVRCEPSSMQKEVDSLLKVGRLVGTVVGDVFGQRCLRKRKECWIQENNTSLYPSISSSPYDSVERN